ncbi:methyl-accepting chemotaxis protein [Candidatus Uabimicrobium sp. HlEnr_7]|uniref:methyl-accepting chemotaxis protein n=1 Tax=Candidatus Uabimicrobium helgolandensis TaxID=3095367 RepID=UPI003558F6F3
MKNKLFRSFMLVALLGVFIGLCNMYFANIIGNKGEDVGEKLVPLASAAMEIRLNATTAHLWFEEIMGGGQEDIEDIWKLLNSCTWYCDVIIKGGRNSKQVFIPSNNEEVKKKIIQVKGLLNEFIKIAQERYKRFGIQQSVKTGSQSDQRFDVLYHSIQDNLDLFSKQSTNIKDVREIGKVKYLIANAHLFLEEILSGDEAETIKVVFDEIDTVVRNVQNWNMQPQTKKKLLGQIDEFKKVARNRYSIWQKNQGVSKIGGEQDENFDKIFMSFNKITEEVEDLIHGAMNEGFQSLSTSKMWANIWMVTLVVIALVVAIVLSVGMTKQINEAANRLSDVAFEISTTVDEHEQTTAQQASSVGETTVTMEELRVSSRKSAEQAEEAAARANQTLVLTEEGTKTVEKTLMEMSNLKEKVGAIADRILRLSEQTSQIGNITNLVTEIAGQTNMLALNAAVEAARAGEYGKGFAVVSAEIRKLADQSKKSAEKINTLVADIQKATNSTVMVTEEGTKSVEGGTVLAQKTAESFQRVTIAMNSLYENTQQISLNMQQQATAIKQVGESMNDLESGSQETALGIKKTRTGVQQLNQASKKLKAMV